MTRLLPDAELLVKGLLTDCDSSAKMPANIAAEVPHRLIYKIAGVAVDPRFLDAPHLQVVSLAASREAAKALAETARVTLFESWRSQVRVADVGGVHKVTEVVSPFEVRTGTEPDGVWRFDATYEVQTRP